MSEFVRIADSAFPLIAAHLWSSTIFIALMLTIVALARKRITAGAVFTIALIGIIKFALPASALTRLVGAITTPASLEPVALTIPLELIAGAFTLVPPAAPRTWPAFLLATSLAVSALLILRELIVRNRLIALTTRTALPASVREIEALRRARLRVGVRRSIDLARSSVCEAPAVLRTLRPLIVLPTYGIDDLTDDEIESLLLHECAHVARYDNLIARLESFLCALFWFHPLIWIAQRITVIERERACDEVAAGSADERDTYLTALRKFCHAAIAPRLPGVSCMATAKLKERIDHVMNYEKLKIGAPAPRKVALASGVMLLTFTFASAIVTETVLAREQKKDDPYSVKVTAERSGETVLVKGFVSDVAAGRVVAAPAMTIASGATARSSSSNGVVDVVFDVRDAGSKLFVDVSVSGDGRLIQRESFDITPDQAAAPAAAKYTGEPITLALKDASLRDVIRTFGQLTGTTMEVAEGVEARVSVNWKNVPWDEAFDSLLADNGLTYRVEGSTIHVIKK